MNEVKISRYKNIFINQRINSEKNEADHEPSRSPTYFILTLRKSRLHRTLQKNIIIYISFWKKSYEY